MGAKEFLEEFSNSAAKIQTHAKPMNTAFGNLFNKTMSDGAIDVLNKELIALGIAIAVRCKSCIILHVQKCLEAGATREQIIEAAGVAVLMGGGPVYSHVPVVIEVLDELSPE